MNRLAMVGAWSALCAVALSRPVGAQDAAPGRGFTFWAYSGGFSIQELTATTAGVPQFAVGVRRANARYGIGLGVVRLSTTEKDVFGPGSSSEQTLRATLIQIGPEAILDVWRSADGRTRGNLGFGASIGRVSSVDRTEDRDPTFGVNVFETKTSGTLLGFHAALGGDHWFSPHFAFGAEAGLRGAFALGLEEEGNPDNTFSAGAAGTYASLRVTVGF